MDDFVNLVTRITALIVAITALVGAIVALWSLLRPHPPDKMPQRFIPPGTPTGFTPPERQKRLITRLENEAQMLVHDPSMAPEVSESVRRTVEELVILVRVRVQDRVQEGVSDEAVQLMTNHILEQLEGRVREGVRNKFTGSTGPSTGGAVTELLEAPQTVQAIDRAIDKIAESVRSKRKRRLSTIAVSLWVVSSLLFMFYLRPESPDARPKNEVLTTNAFFAFEKEKWENAKEYAQECINEYGDLAKNRQEELEKQKAPLPSLRDVSEQNKQRIHQEGLVNDIAASYWILGRASEKLNETDEAIAAYTQAATFTYAAIWDPKGWFWSPAQDAAARLEPLRAKRDLK